MKVRHEKPFVEHILPPIYQGVQGGREILMRLQALTPEVDGDIQTTAEVIEARLSDFC